MLNDLVQPGGGGRGEVQCEPPALLHPFPDLPVLVDGKIVHDDMEVTAGILPVQPFQKPEEGFMGVAVDRFGRHCSLMHRKGCQKTGGSVSFRRGRQSPGLPHPHGKSRLRPVQGMDPGFLIHREDQGVFRRVQVQSQDRRLFFLELRVRTASAPVFVPMRLEGSFRQDPVHRRLRQSGGPGQFGFTPPGAPVRRGSGGDLQNFQAFLRRKDRRLSRPVSIPKTFQPPLHKPDEPFAGILSRQSGLPADLGKRKTRDRQENHFRPLGHSLFSLSGSRPHRQCLFLGFGNGQMNDGSRKHGGLLSRRPIIILFMN